MIIRQDGRFGVFPVMGLDPGGSVGEQSNLHLDAGPAHSLHDGEWSLVRVLKWAQLMSLEANMCDPIKILGLVHRRLAVA